MATLLLLPHLLPSPIPLERTPPAPRTLLWPFVARSSRPFLFYFDGGPGLLRMAGGGQIPVPERCEAARMQVSPVQSPSPMMGPSYEHSLEIRHYTTASGPGFDGDEDIALSGSTTHVGAAASASGAHHSDVGGSRGTVAAKATGRNQATSSTTDALPTFLAPRPTMLAATISQVLRRRRFPGRLRRRTAFPTSFHGDAGTTSRRCRQWGTTDTTLRHGRR